MLSRPGSPAGKNRRSSKGSILCGGPSGRRCRGRPAGNRNKGADSGPDAPGRGRAPRRRLPYPMHRAEGVCPPDPKRRKE